MKRILIADASKASLVMTSEVFKDNYPGIQVLVARNSAEAVSLAKNTEDIDAFILDYDLPDKNGAQTALLIKKISKTPILITAFDTNDVVNDIENLLVKYDDCRSWLKKPVNPEVVIAVAQRYCEGKIRTQKRIPCHLPVLATMEVKESAAKSKVTKTVASKTKATDKKTTKTVEEKVTKQVEKLEPISLYFHGIIEDCSLSGVKLKPNKHSINGLTDWTKFLEKIESITSGNTVTLTLPPFLDIEIGKIPEIPKTQSNNIAKKKIKITQLEEGAQELSGKVVWTNADSGEWRMGIEFENQTLSKRLFEAIVAFQSRQHKSLQNQSILKASRII